MKKSRSIHFVVSLFICYYITPGSAQVHDSQPSKNTPKVSISPHIEQLEINTRDRTIIIRRNPDPMHTIAPPFDKTSRPCPPFCIQPISAGSGVQTIGELEMIEHLQKSADKEHTMIIDVRLPEWHLRETIPLAINLPKGLLLKHFDKIAEKHLGAKKTPEGWKYANAKTLVIFCNGYWSPDSFQIIQLLLSQKYPPEKIKWYRGGMQAWLSLGLTTESVPQ